MPPQHMSKLTHYFYTMERGFTYAKLNNTSEEDIPSFTPNNSSIPYDEDEQLNIALKLSLEDVKKEPVTINKLPQIIKEKTVKVADKIKEKWNDPTKSKLEKI